MNKMFKHFIAALAIVLVALSVSGCEVDTMHYLAFVEMKVTSPSDKKLHVEFEVDKFDESSGYTDDNPDYDEPIRYIVMDNSEIDRVIVFGLGLDNKNYHFQETIYGQSTGSVDFELDEKTYGVEITVRAVLKNPTRHNKTVYSTSDKYWFQEHL